MLLEQHNWPADRAVRHGDHRVRRHPPGLDQGHVHPVEGAAVEAKWIQ